MSRKKLLAGGILLVLLLGAGFIIYQHQASATTTTARQTAILERGNVSATVTSAGNLYAPDQVSLSFGATGVAVTELNVAVGDEVKSGDVLARVDDSQLRAALKTAETSLASAQAQYDALNAPATTAELTAAQAQVNAAQDSYNAAVAALAESQAPASALDVQAASAKLASAQESYKSAQAVSEMTTQQITVARASLETARIALQAAQAAYDRIAWRDDAPASSEASALQTATIAYASAQAQYDLTLAEMNSSALKTAQANLA